MCHPFKCLYNTHAHTHRTFRFLHYETARFLHDIVKSPEIGLDGTRILKSIARYTYSAFATQTFGMDVRVSYPVHLTSLLLHVCWSASLRILREIYWGGAGAECR
jgi:hypothetical protein